MGRGKSSQTALHTVGSRVWLANDKDGFMRGEVIRLDGPKLRVKLEDGSEKDCAEEEIPLQNPDQQIQGVEVGGRAAGRAACGSPLGACWVKDGRGGGGGRPPGGSCARPFAHSYPAHPPTPAPRRT